MRILRYFKNLKMKIKNYLVGFQALSKKIYILLQCCIDLCIVFATKV